MDASPNHRAGTRAPSPTNAPPLPTVTNASLVSNGNDSFGLRAEKVARNAPTAQQYLCWVSLVIAIVAAVAAVGYGLEGGIGACAITSQQDTFNASLTDVTIAYSVVEASKIPGSLLAGVLADHSRTLGFQMSAFVAVFAVGVLIIGVSTGVGMMGAGYVLVGIGVAVVGVAPSPLIDFLIPADKKHRSPQLYAAVVAMGIVGIALGFLSCAMTIESAPEAWRWNFIGTAAGSLVPAAMLSLAWVWIRPRRDAVFEAVEAEARADRAAAARLAREHELLERAAAQSQLHFSPAVDPAAVGVVMPGSDADVGHKASPGPLAASYRATDSPSMDRSACSEPYGDDDGGAAPPPPMAGSEAALAVEPTVQGTRDAPDDQPEDATPPRPPPTCASRFRDVRQGLAAAGAIPAIRWTILSQSAGLFSISAYGALLPLFLEKGLGQSRKTTGYVLAAAVPIIAIATLAGGMLVKRRKWSVKAQLGLVTAAACIATPGSFIFLTNNLAVFLALLAIPVFGGSLRVAPSVTLLAQAARRAVTGFDDDARRRHVAKHMRAKARAERRARRASPEASPGSPSSPGVLNTSIVATDAGDSDDDESNDDGPVAPPISAEQHERIARITAISTGTGFCVTRLLGAVPGPIVLAALIDSGTLDIGPAFTVVGLFGGGLAIVFGVLGILEVGPCSCELAPIGSESAGGEGTNA